MRKASDWVYQPGAAATAAQLETADSTRRNRLRDIEQFLQFLEDRNDQLPVNVEYMSTYNAYLNDCGYADAGARRSHIWRWLQAVPPINNMVGLDTSGWSTRRWRAERLSIRLNANYTTSGAIATIEQDCVRATIKNQPEKAPPVRLSAIAENWGKFTHRQRGIVVLAANTGLRTDSILAMRPGDIKVGDGFQHRVSVLVGKDKIEDKQNRILWLNCNCAHNEGLPSPSALCPIHSGYLEGFKLPVLHTEFAAINAALRIKGHSWRRTMALRIRKLLEIIPFVFSRTSILHHLGWSDPKRLACYAADLRRWDNINLIPSEIAIFLDIIRTVQAAVSEFIWYDMAKQIGETKIIIPQCNLQGQSAKPSRAFDTAPKATGGTTVMVHVKRKQWEKGARLIHDQWVVPAKPRTMNGIRILPYNEHWEPEAYQSTIWIDNWVAARNIEITNPGGAALVWQETVKNIFTCVYVQAKHKISPQMPGMSILNENNEKAPSQEVYGAIDNPPECKTIRTKGAGANANALWGRLAWDRNKEKRQQKLAGKTLFNRMPQTTPATKIQTVKTDTKERTSSLLTTHGEKEIVKDALIMIREDPKVLQINLPSKAEQVNIALPEPRQKEEMRNIIKRKLKELDLAPTYGWKLNVVHKSGCKWEIRGTCNQCPRKKREDGTTMSDTTCGVSFNGALRVGDTTLELRLNDGAHTVANALTCWPSA